jgi:16S rRNA (uracil1498-N3)-methyltransferase
VAVGRLALFVGPEGGFTSEEVESARAAGVSVVSLGPRILRAETAGPLFAALALYQSGDI